MENQDHLELGQWIGRNRAFHFLSDHCLAARAQCLDQMRSSRAYEALGLTWDEFCSRHAGISRATADRLIQKRREFGEAYFRLAEIMRISAAVYREIEASVTPEGIEIDGKIIPLTPQNAPNPQGCRGPSP